MTRVAFGENSLAVLTRVTPKLVLDWIEQAGFRQVFAITDSNVDAVITRNFGVTAKCVIAPGETSKSVENWLRIQEWLADSGADRSSCVLAIGGGVVTDLSGFAAATYMRGISWFAIATSLMAQLDAAHGGKTGIDLSCGKNLIGAFHFPITVFCDVEHLKSLPKREIGNGLAEAIKYGFALDESLLTLVEQPVEPLDAIVRRCVELKAKVVRDDPLERTGERAVLNFGHTVGHAIETAAGYGRILHGEAVMIGMIIEARIGRTLGITPPEVEQRLKALAVAKQLPHELPTGTTPADLMAVMKRDKKSRDGKLTMSLLQNVGSCRVVADIDERVVRDALEAA